MLYKNLLLVVSCLILLSCSSEIKESENIVSYSSFHELPLTSIKPAGWLHEILLRQKDGLTGHLGEAGYPFNSKWWGNPEPEENISTMKWWPYEQEAYWLDGMIRCGFLLGDTKLIARATKQVEYVLQHPDSSGYLGPSFMKKSPEGDRWAHAVFFRAAHALFNATEDVEILTALRDHYLGDRYSSIDTREMVNIETILYVYKYLGDKDLFDFATDLYLNFQKVKGDKAGTEKYFKKDEPASIHGVTYNELAKLGAIMYSLSGDLNQLEASFKAIERIQNYHMMPDGVNVSCEKMRYPVHSLQSHETCDIADFTWTLYYLLKITGNPVYADMIEKAIFNAAPSVVDSSFKAVQYFSSVNQVLADKNSCHTPQGMGSAAMSYRPNPYTECCPANVNRIFPNYASNLWCESSDNEIVALLYAPSKINWLSQKSKIPVTIEEITEYPFSDTITFIFSTPNSTKFSFVFRIPEWCKKPVVLVNGRHFNVDNSKNAYRSIERKYTNGDKIQLVFPQQISVHQSVDNGLWLERGPLVYSLAIEEDWRIDNSDLKSTIDFPAYNLYAASKWNYALSFSKSIPIEDQVSIERKPMTSNPWTIGSSPISLLVPAREVIGWSLINCSSIEEEHWLPVLDNDGNVVDWEMKGYLSVKGNFNFTPPIPETAKLKEMLLPQVERIKLVPYGCTKLRITVFPDAVNL
ncbi:MAG: glycoside hydrolase family 127 protein [Prolixibacteraceae bacterium]|nr:glycoside hydrolase family 127 protein [Prolixibacteraceae bacterium]